MATRNLVPRADGEGSLGRADKKWGAIYAGDLHVDTILSEKTPTKDTDLTNKLYVDEQDASTLQAAKDNTTQAVNSLKTQIQQEYLKKEEASTTYLTQVNASTTYLKQSDANANYMKKTDAESTYLKQSDANNDYVAKNGVYLKSGTEQNGTVSLLKGDGTYFKFDRSIHLLKRNTSYVVGDVAVSPNLPSWAYMKCTTAGITGEEEPSLSTINISDVITDGTAQWVIQTPFPQNGGINTPIMDNVAVNGDIYSGRDDFSHSMFFQFRKDTTEANAVNIFCIPNGQIGNKNAQAGIGFFREANNGEVCAYLGNGNTPWSNGLRIYADRITFQNAQLHYIKNTYINGLTCYQQDDTGLISQCGRSILKAGSDGSATLEVTLPHPMKNTNYNVFTSIAGTVGASLFSSGMAKSTTQIYLKIYNFPAEYSVGINWLVKGMGA